MTYEEYKENLKKNLNKQIKLEIIKKTLHDKPNLRKTFIAVIVKEPTRKKEIQEITFFTAKTIYVHLYELISMGLIKEIAVMDIWNKTELTGIEKHVLNKFKEWTSTMSDNQRSYYAGKTHYWVTTELGRNKEIMEWICKLDTELRTITKK